jgi:uncharacterized Zn-binding protein involved in type VI secretion
MGFPAARIGDMHTCPFVFTPPPPAPPIPAVGGPIITGFPTVLTMGPPQARITDLCSCVPPTPPHPITKGSPTVLVGGLPAARMTDMCSFGGPIVMGAPTVLIGP